MKEPLGEALGHAPDDMGTEDGFGYIVCRCGASLVGYGTEHTLLAWAIHLKMVCSSEPYDPERTIPVILGCGCDGEMVAPPVSVVADINGWLAHCDTHKLWSCQHPILDEKGVPSWELSSCPMVTDEEQEAKR